MGDHHEWNRFEGRSCVGRVEEHHDRWQQELQGEHEQCRTPYRMPQGAVSGNIEFGSCYPQQDQYGHRDGNFTHGWQQGGYDSQQWGHRDGNFVHAWQQGSYGYDACQPQAVEVPNYYQPGFQVGVVMPDVYPAPVAPDFYPAPVVAAPNYYENNNSVYGGPGGFAASQQQIETGAAPDSTMGTVGTIFNDALAGFDAFAAYDIARRDASAPRYRPVPRWR